MATSAFKSTSRRGGGSGSENSPTKNPPIRRSHSVSALSRAHHHHLHNQSDVTSDFLNKRDNPLFWTTASPPDNNNDTENSSAAVAAGVGRFAETTVISSGGTLTSKAGSADGRSERGRSVTRNSDKKVVVGGGGKKDVPGRSLSRVDTAQRGRSVSRGHYAASESEVERDSVVLSTYRSKVSSDVAANNVKKANLGRKAADTRRRSTERRPIKPSDDSASYSQIPNCEDGISVGSLSEAEEKTIKAVCEQMKSFQGDHTGRGDTPANGIYETVRSEVRRAISDIQNDLGSALKILDVGYLSKYLFITEAMYVGTNVADIPPDLVNPGAVELVLDIRREYARKFEESQERARKLRADLAVEEHRGQELTRILKEILPDPKPHNVQKPRPGRKNSSERKKMSKRLTEEAMNYFDECVSISTFDSSDFSVPEDPLLNSIGATTPAAGIASLAQCSPSISSSRCIDSFLNHNQESGDRSLLQHNHMGSNITASSSTDEPMTNQSSARGNNAELVRKSKFSFSRKPTENAGLQQDIRNYIKNIEKEFDTGGINSENLKPNYYDPDERFLGRTESLLIDRVLFKDRLDSGSLHLCGGGVTVSFTPFGLC